MRPAATALALLALCAAGCDDDAAGGGGSRSEESALSGPLTFQRAGGLRFVQDKLTVAPDGSSTLASYRDAPKPVHLTDRQLDSLARALEGTDLAGVAGDTTGEKPVPDDIAYSISYEGHTVTTSSTALPDELRELVGELNRLVDALARG